MNKEWQEATNEYLKVNLKSRNDNIVHRTDSIAESKFGTYHRDIFRKIRG